MKQATDNHSSSYAYISATLLQLAKCSPVSKAIFYKTAKGDYGEHDQFIGVNVPSLRVVAKEFHDISLDDIRALLCSKISAIPMSCVNAELPWFQHGTS